MLILAEPSMGDEATIVNVGNERSNMPATNLQTMQPTDLWESTNLTNMFFEIDLGSAKEFNLIALLYTNARAESRIQIRSADTQGDLTGAPDWTFGAAGFWTNQGDEGGDTSDLATWDRTHALVYLPEDVGDRDSQTNRWIRIDLSDTDAGSHPDGVFRVGRLYIAKAWQPAINAQFGLQWGWRDESPRTRVVGGPTIVTERDPWLTARFELDFLTQTDMLDNAFRLGRLRGSKKDILAVTDVTKNSFRHHKMIYGLLGNAQPISLPRFDSHQIQLEVMQLL